MLHMLGIGLTLGSTIPLVSLTLERWGSDATTIGIAGAMSPLAILCTMPFLPRLARRLGAVRAMLVGCSIAVATLVLMYVVRNAPFWIAARFAIGAGLALPWLVGDVWVNAVSTEANRGKVIGLYVACFFSGFATGPLLLDVVGIDGFAPHALGVAALSLALVPLVLVRALAPPMDVAGGSGLVGAMRAVPLAGIGALAAGFTESAAFALLPVWGLDVGLGESGALRLLTVFIVGGVMLQLSIGPLADRLDRQRLMIAIGIALAAVTLALPLTGGAFRFALVFAAGGFVLASYGLSLTLLGERFEADELAVASAAFLVLYQIGSVGGPVAVGLAMEAFGATGFTVGLAVSGLALALGAVPRPRSSRPGRGTGVA